MKKKKLQKKTEDPDTNTSISDPIDILRIYDSVPIPIAIYNDLDKSIKLNRKFTEIFGYSEDEIKEIDDWWNLSIPDEERRNALKTEWKKRLRDSIKNNKLSWLHLTKIWTM